MPHSFFKNSDESDLDAAKRYEALAGEFHTQIASQHGAEESGCRNERDCLKAAADFYHCAGSPDDAERCFVLLSEREVTPGRKAVALAWACVSSAGEAARKYRDEALKLVVGDDRLYPVIVEIIAGEQERTVYAVRFDEPKQNPGESVANAAKRIEAEADDPDSIASKKVIYYQAAINLYRLMGGWLKVAECYVKKAAAEPGTRKKAFDLVEAAHAYQKVSGYEVTVAMHVTAARDLVKDQSGSSRDLEIRIRDFKLNGPAGGNAGRRPSGHRFSHQRHPYRKTYHGCEYK